MSTASPALAGRLPLSQLHATVLCLITQLCPILCYRMDCTLPGSSVQWDSSGNNTGMGCHALLQGIFPTQGSNPGLPHCRKILYHLSHQGSLRIQEWLAYPFSRGSSSPRNQTKVSCIAGDLYQLSYQGSPITCIYIHIYSCIHLFMSFM